MEVLLDAIPFCAASDSLHERDLSQISLSQSIPFSYGLLKLIDLHFGRIRPRVIHVMERLIISTCLQSVDPKEIGLQTTPRKIRSILNNTEL